jgi:hypothetical protein
MTPLQLSTKGMLSPDQLLRRNFTFVSGSDRFTCDRFQAIYLSRRVSAAISRQT